MADKYINKVIIGNDNNGGCNTIRSTYQYGVRPALILYSNALFDKTTMLLKGVA